MDIRQELVFLTQNIFGGGPGWRARRHRIARRIAALRPDVVGLQEVHAPEKHGDRSQAHELARMVAGYDVEYHVDFAPGRVTESGHSEGVALLCKSGIRERSVESLTLDRDDFLDRSSPRIVLCAMLEAFGVGVDVFVTHLSLSYRARTRTVRELARFAAAERARSRSGGAVLLGDLNALPHEACLRMLEKGEDACLPWVDAWRVAKGARARGGTWPAILPFRRIDYVFVQPGATWRIESCEREPLVGSDHRGVLARITL